MKLFRYMLLTEPRLHSRRYRFCGSPLQIFLRREDLAFRSRLFHGAQPSPKDFLLERFDELMKIAEIPLKPTDIAIPKSKKSNASKKKEEKRETIDDSNKPKDKKGRKRKVAEKEVTKSCSTEGECSAISISASSDERSDIPSSPFNHLRPYQRECIEATLKSLREGFHRQAVSLPVGTGKTVVMSHLIPLIPSPTPEATKTLVIAHRQELLFQAMHKISLNCPTLKVDIERGSHKCDVQNTDVIIASVQSLGVRSSTRLERFDPKLFKCVIIDEAHHASATSYINILKHFGLYKRPAFRPEQLIAKAKQESIQEAGNVECSPEELNSKIFLWGCSATLRRHDGVGLASVFDYISYHKDFFDMVKEKWLCDIQVTTIKTTVDLSDIASNAGDFVQAQLAPVVDTPPRNELIVHTFNRLAGIIELSSNREVGRKCTLVFAINIKHVENLKKTFQRLGHSAVSITSKTPSDLRAFYLEQFRFHKINIIINCSILTEGLDIPSVDCIIMARPTRSKPLYQQMLGRGMRQYGGKENCLILDFVDILRDKSLCTVPTLLGLEYDTEFMDGSLSEAVKQLPKEPTKLVLPSPPTIQDIKLKHYGTIHDLGQDKQSQWFIGFHSDYEWIFIKEGLYVLPLSVGIVRIEKQKDDSYAAKFRRRLPFIGPGLGKAYPLPISADSLEMLVRATETFVARVYPKAIGVARKNSAWRKHPATPSQLKVLARFFKAPEPDQEQPAEENEHLKHLTRGEAANLITLIKEGGLRAYRDAIRNTERAIRMEVKREAKCIKVGPLDS
ncbi:putative ATP-dependent helicase IRC3 [Entomophthora muscae]|uniref:ATP-dependent helicase IRC3 n=1 Tax=Entomophthora muscae TaxID=34485 RepID=A0ACC2SA25_9FUNG|nr:putative ATP-dependent helicase IRC3 [Entomophthora muscae]